MAALAAARLLALGLLLAAHGPHSAAADTGPDTTPKTTGGGIRLVGATVTQWRAVARACARVAAVARGAADPLLVGDHGKARAQRSGAGGGGRRRLLQGIGQSGLYLGPLGFFPNGMTLCVGERRTTPAPYSYITNTHTRTGAQTLTLSPQGSATSLPPHPLPTSPTAAASSWRSHPLLPVPHPLPLHACMSAGGLRAS
jgi:hypothetical protein